MFASRGMEIPFPSSDVHFVHRWIYEWALEFEFSTAAYWLGDYPASLAACERLLERDPPDQYQRHVHMNREHCLRALGSTAKPSVGEMIE